MVEKRSSWIALLLVFAVAMPVFADRKQLKAFRKDFLKAIAADNESAAIELMGDIADLDTEDAFDTLYDLGLKYATTPKLYEEALDNLSQIDSALTYVSAKYDKIDNKSDFRERVYLVDITAKIGSSEAVTGLGSYLEDKSSFVQGAAVEHLAKSESSEAIGPLIDLLKKLTKKRKDVLYHQVRDALWTLTGQDFDVIEDWIAWWEPNKGNFDPKKSDHEGKTGVQRKRRGQDPDFWGVPVESKNVVFVIDTSGSMRYVMKNDIPGLGRGDGSDSGGSSGGGNMTPEDIRLATFWMRINMAKRELVRVIKALGKDAFFNCVQFDTATTKFLKKAVPSTGGNKKKALKWIEGIKHRGNTSTLEALVKAFNADAKTNTIYFLSDGLPSRDGKTNDPTRPILDKLFELNRFRKIKIHTFGFDPVPYPSGGQANPDLLAANAWLKELSDATGGKFTVMKVDEKRTPDNPDGN